MAPLMVFTAACKVCRVEDFPNIELMADLWLFFWIGMPAEVGSVFGDTELMADLWMPIWVDTPAGVGSVSLLKDRFSARLTNGNWSLLSFSRRLTLIIETSLVDSARWPLLLSVRLPMSRFFIYKSVLSDSGFDKLIKVRAIKCLEVYKVDFYEARKRTAELNEQIQQGFPKIYRMRRLQLFSGDALTVSAYVITLRKMSEHSFAERVTEFWMLLKSALLPQERVEIKNRCFCVSGAGYEILYCIEAYKKCAEQIGYMEGDQAITALLHRRSCEVAAKKLNEQKRASWHTYYRSLPSVFPTIYDEMNEAEWMEAYPNPADRFVFLVSKTEENSKKHL